MKKNIIKSVLFLGILAIILSFFSWLSLEMDRNENPILNHSGHSIFAESDNTIDVLFIGNSNVYSAISPMYLWEKYGYTSYTWGDAAQRIPEAYENLKKIYRHQKPSVVFLEVGSVYRDGSDITNLDSIVKAKMAAFFPVISYHFNFDKDNLNRVFSEKHSITKGYYIRKDYKKMKKKDRLSPTDKIKAINGIARWQLKKCIDLCKKNGSQVVLLYVPTYTDWSMKRYNALLIESENNNVPYVDLNIELAEVMNWRKDTPDGEHLNIYGAKKASKWIGQYLNKHYKLTDHRLSPEYEKWNEDLNLYKLAMKSLK